MHRIKQLIIGLLVIISTSVFAANEADIQQQRIDAIKQYVKLIGRGDAQSMPRLFTKTAVVVSASGETDSAHSFYEKLFANTMHSPRAHLINIFDGQLKDNMMTAYYNLNWSDKKGNPVAAKFLDLFIFQADSAKIKTVYVFSNSFHQDEFATTS